MWQKALKIKWQNTKRLLLCIVYKENSVENDGSLSFFLSLSLLFLYVFLSFSLSLSYSNSYFLSLSLILSNFLSFFLFLSQTLSIFLSFSISNSLNHVLSLFFPLSLPSTLTHSHSPQSIFLSFLSCLKGTPCLQRGLAVAVHWPFGFDDKPQVSNKIRERDW